MRARPPASNRNRAGDAGFAIVVIAGALVLGLVPSAASVPAALAICFVGLSVLTVVLLRRSVSAPPMATPGDPPAEAVPAPSPSTLGFARLLFYLGTITVAQSSLRGAGVTVSEALFICSFSLCAIAALRGERILLLPRAFVAGALLFAAGGMVSTLGADSPTGSAFQLMHAIYVVVLWTWTAAMVLQTKRHFAVAITLWAVSAAIDGIGATTQAFGVHALAGAPEGDRMTSFTEHPNDLGGALAVALIPALLLATAARPGELPTTRLLRWVPVLLVATGLALSASVTGMAAAAAALVIWLSAPVVPLSARFAVVGGVLAALLVVSLAGGRVVSPTQRLELVTSPGVQPTAGSGQDRLSIAETVWPRIADDPFVGTGLDVNATAATIVSHGQTIPYQVHGLPLAAWYGAGIFGLLGLVIVFCSLAAGTVRNIRYAADPEEALMGWALLGTFVSFVVFSLSGPMYFQQYAWVAVAIGVAWAVRTGHRGRIPAGHSDSFQRSAGLRLATS